MFVIPDITIISIRVTDIYDLRYILYTIFFHPQLMKINLLVITTLAEHMKKAYIEIASSVGAVALFIILIVIVNTIFSAYAAYGNVAILVVFVVGVGLIGLKLAEISN